jgi:hypothetical protein
VKLNQINLKTNLIDDDINKKIIELDKNSLMTVIPKDLKINKPC